MGRAIFISYRRDDTEGEAGRLYDDLVRTYGDDSVFMDVAGITPGIDFRNAIDDNVATCGVLLAVIGPQWATITDRSGQRRLEDSNDFVRLEISAALARQIAVIPVLVHDARMPHPDELPENLKDLTFRSAVELTHARWNSDVALLTKALLPYVKTPGPPSSEPVHANIPAPLPPANPPHDEPPKMKASKTGLIAGSALAAVVLLGLVAYFAFGGSPDTGTPSNQPIEVAMAPSAKGSHNSGSSNPGGSRPTSSASPIMGTWTYPAAGGANTLSRLEITGRGDQLSIHAWGNCTGCDWGVQPATLYGQEATAKWTFSQAMGGDAPGRVATVAMSLDGDKLAVTTSNTFPDRKPNRRQVDFVRAP